MKKSVKIIFTLSIALNLLFIGLVGGYIYRVKFTPKPWEEVKSKLSPETRDVIRTSFKEGRGEIIPLIRDIRKKKKAMKQIITANEFDVSAYNNLVQEIQALDRKFIKSKYDRVGNILSKLPQEERLKMADHLVGRLFGRMGNMKKMNKKQMGKKTGKSFGGDMRGDK